MGMKSFGLKHALLMGAAAFGLGVAATAPSPAYAQESTRSYDIPAQDLDDALREFGRQTGRDVLFTPDAVAGKRSGALVGQMTERQALESLLAGSGLRFEQTASGGYAVQDPNSPTRLGDAGDAVPSDDGATAEILVVGRRTLNTDIRRTEDDAQPYVVFGAEEIERSQSLNVEDFLRARLPMNAASTTFDQRATQDDGSVAFGGINLRGLGIDQTLVLVDGRRVVGANNIVGDIQQPNLSGIPVTAIERIEILPSTAGGIYGGNATGGVVNVILKRDYSGIEVDAEYGSAFRENSGFGRFGVGGGISFGDRHRTSLMFSASHLESDTLLVSDRNFAQRARARLLENNPSALMLQDVIFGGEMPPQGATTNLCAGADFEDLGEFFYCTGETLTLDDGTSLDATIASLPPGYAGPASDGGAGIIPGVYNFGIADFREPLLRPPTSDALRVSMRQEITSNLELFADFVGSRYESDVVSRGLYREVFLPAAAPENPFQQGILMNVPVFGIELGVQSEIENLQFTSGVILRLPHRWSAALDGSWGRSTTNLAGGDGLSLAANPVIAAAGLRDLETNPLDLSAFPAIASLSSEIQTTQENHSLRLSGPFLRTPGGSVTWTGAIEYRNAEIPDSIVTGDFFEPARLVAARSQSVQSYYAETRIPLIAPDSWMGRSLELQASVRQDEYETTSTRDRPIASTPDGPFAPVNYTTNTFRSTDYTLGLRYEPMSGLMLRASLGTGFFPPGVNRIGSTTTSSSVSTLNCCLAPGGDPRRGNTPFSGNALGRYDTIRGGTPDLRPEESESLSIGFVLQPESLSGLRISLDYTQIEKSGEFGGLSAGYVIANESMLPGRVVRGQNLPGDPAGYAGPIIELDLSTINIAQTEIGAFDFQVDYRWNTDLGDFHAFLIGTYTDRFARQLLPSSQSFDTVGFSDGPLEWRGNFGLQWSNGPWSLWWNSQYFDGYSIRLSDAEDFDNDLRVLNHGSESVPSQLYHDLSVGYRFNDDDGNYGSELRIGIQNVLDEEPPLEVPYNFGHFYSQYGDPRLRRFTVAVRHSF